MYCRQCGQQIPNNAQVCPACGAPQGRTKFCQHCGAAIAESSVVCPSCGGQVATLRTEQAPIIINNSNANTSANTSSNANTSDNTNVNRNTNANVNVNGAYSGVRGPVRQLKTNRSLLKLILLSIITLGIYGLAVMYSVTEDVNTICTPYDRKKSMNYLLLVFVFSWLTLGIAPLVWSHRISTRIGNELRRRGINYSFGAGTFWGWGILGVIVLIGPFVYTHKLLRSMNLLCADYNVYG